MADFLAEAKGLTLEERIELTYSLWDEIMDGFKGWAPSTLPRPDQAQPPVCWEKIKARVDVELNKSDRFKLAQELWEDIAANGYDPEPTAEQITELERRAEELQKHPERGRPAEEVFAEIEQRIRGRK